MPEKSKKAVKTVKAVKTAKQIKPAKPVKSVKAVQPVKAAKPIQEKKESVEMITVGDIDVYIEGKGKETIVMIHGWPDTYRLWEPQVKLLKDNFRCVRFSLPGYEISKPRKLYTFQEEFDTIKQIIDTVSPKQKVILMTHDWGCVFGYQYYMQNKDRVSKIIGMDIGDAGSKNMKLPFKMIMFAISYQLFLASAWLIGGKTGDKMTKWLSKKFKIRADINLIHSGMNYPYFFKWKSTFLRKPTGAVPFEPECPMLFMFGKNKPTMFHSQNFVDAINGRKGSNAIGFEAGHWLMLDKPAEVNKEISKWLGVNGK